MWYQKKAAASRFFCACHLADVLPHADRLDNLFRFASVDHTVLVAVCGCCRCRVQCGLFGDHLDRLVG